MEEMTRCRSSKAAFFFDEHIDASTAADSVSTAGALAEDVEEGQDEGVVVEICKIPPPEAPVGVVVGVEGVEDAVEVDGRVGNEFERLGSEDTVWRWG